MNQPANDHQDEQERGEEERALSQLPVTALDPDPVGGGGGLAGLDPGPRLSLDSGRPLSLDSGDRPQNWSPQHELAAFLLAEGVLTGDKAAQKVGIGRSTLVRWQRDNYFQARVKELRGALLDEVYEQSIAQKQLRVLSLVGRARRLASIVDARSQDPELVAQPGGDSGYLAKRLKVTPGGEVFEEYALDQALLKEQARLDVMIAKELGQLVEKSEVKTMNLNVDSQLDQLNETQREAIRRALTEG